MIGERLTDGETEATLKYLLDADGKPAIYKGKELGAAYNCRCLLSQ